MGLDKDKQQMLFKIGYTAKGIVYVLMGFFAAAALIGLSKSPSGPKKIIEWMGQNPWGRITMGAIGLGLLCYCLWRLYQAIMDTEAEGKDASGVVKRIGWAVSGIAYGTLSVFAFKEAFFGGGNSGDQKQDIIAQILSLSYGQILIGILGVIIAGVACYQLYRGLTDKHMEKVESQQLSHDEEKLFRTAGRVGLTARFVVYGIIAYFLFKAALLDDASKFKGMGEAMRELEGTGGSLALIVLGLGLMAYGFFMFVRARYERV